MGSSGIPTGCSPASDPEIPVWVCGGMSDVRKAIRAGVALGQYGDDAAFSRAGFPGFCGVFCDYPDGPGGLAYFPVPRSLSRLSEISHKFPIPKYYFIERNLVSISYDNETIFPWSLWDFISLFDRLLRRLVLRKKH